MAAHVEKLKGKKALIVLDGMPVSKGDMVETIDPMTRKKTAFLKITTVKDNKAIAQVVRGRAKINQEVHPKSGGKNEATSEMPTSRKKSNRSNSNNSTFAVGGLLGVGFDTMKINIGTPAESITQTGMGLSLMGAADMWLNNWFSFRAMVGAEQFNVKGNSTLGTTPCASCDTKITYFTGMAWGRIHLLETVWFGGALGLQLPLSKSTNALEESSITTTAMYAVGGGADIALGSNMYLPVQVEYGMQPKSADVSSSYYSVRLGIMLRY